MPLQNCYTGDVVEMRIGRDETRAVAERRCVDERIRHGEFIGEAQRGCRHRNVFVDIDHDAPQSFRLKNLNVRFRFRAEQDFAHFVQNYDRNEDLHVFLEIGREKIRLIVSGDVFEPAR